MEQRVWIKAFWGFDPMESAALGFTKEGDRQTFLSRYRPEDLVLIYGTSQPPTLPYQRGQCLGFLRLDPRPVPENDYASPAELHRRRQSGNLHRWTFGVPIIEAWKVVGRVRLTHLAPKAFHEESPRIISKRGTLLAADEAKSVLRLRVQKASVRGLPPVSALKPMRLVELLKPSKAIPQGFGVRSVERVDGPHFCYLMELTGDPKVLLNRNEHDVYKKSIVKVGVSQNPDRRVEDLNKSLPGECAIKWKIVATSNLYPDWESGVSVENRLKIVFDRYFDSLGNEFFLANLDKACSEFRLVTHNESDALVGQIRR